MFRNSIIALLFIVTAGCTTRPRPDNSTTASDVDKKTDFALAAGLLPPIQPGETQSCSAIDDWAMCCNGAPPSADTGVTDPLTITVGEDTLVVDDVGTDLKRTCCCACNQHGCDCDCGPDR